MRIGETFATAVRERIEPVVKVADRRPRVLLGELASLVVTPQWERYVRQILDAYTDAAERDDEQGIGIWISGFFGSGKSLLLKVIGALLEGGELEGRQIDDIFLERLPAASADRSTIARFLKVARRKLTTTSVGGNLHAMQARSEEQLPLIAFRLFAADRGYTHSWPLAWAIEYEIDARGATERFRDRAAELCREPWEAIAENPAFHGEQLNRAAAEVLADKFSRPEAVQDATNQAMAGGITPTTLVERLRRWCAARDAGGRRHKLLLQLDEVGQWIAGDPNARTMQVQALAETAAGAGNGRIWLAVTAHGDVQALRHNVDQAQYAKIIQRFAIPCKLSNDDIGQVVEQRLLCKTQEARVALRSRFEARAGELADLGALQGASRVYPLPDGERFPLFYPYLPWTVAVVPDVVKGIAQAAGREEALTGSNRTMIGVVQGALIETPGLLEEPVGRVLALADIYEQVASDVPIETKTDLNRIAATVPGAKEATTRVARGLFLLGQLKEHIPTTLPNVARALIDSLDKDLASTSREVGAELERLVGAGYVKRVGDQYAFLTTQQRGFQDRVRARRDELAASSYDLSQALKEYDSEEALRFERVPLHGSEVALKLEIDGRVARNPAATATVRVISPLQRALDPSVANDEVLRQRSAQEPDTVIVRLAEVAGLRDALALEQATREVADKVSGGAQTSGAEIDVARQAKAQDLPGLRGTVLTLLGQAVRGAVVFCRGSTYHLGDGASPSAAARTTLAEVLPSIYARFGEVPHRIVNEESAVRAALSGNAANGDLHRLGVFRADGTLNESHPLVATLRGKLPQAQQDQGALSAEALRAELERPPFGWDGNCIKVGLALLLRASACRLIENGRAIADPSDPDAAAILSKEQRFRAVRVQGVRTEIDVTALQRIRGYLETIYPGRWTLVAATMHAALGEKLKGTAERARALQSWAQTAQCPLPPSFDQGMSLIDELVNAAAPAARLPRFLADANAVLQFAEQLDAIEAFKNEHAAAYGEMRDYFNRMVNADLELAEVRRFIEDWRTVAHERSVTFKERWNELTRAQATARAAEGEQVRRWWEEARATLRQLEAGLEERVRTAGVPAAEVAGEVAALTAMLDEARTRLARPNPGLGEARGVRSALAASEIDVARRIAELRAKYRPPVETERPVTLRLGEIVAQKRIETDKDLERLLKGLEAAIRDQLDQGKVVVLE